MDFDLLPVLIWTVSGDSCTFTNRYWQSVTGFSAERSLGGGWLSAFHEDDREKLTAMLSGEIDELAARLIVEGGRGKWVQLKSRAIGANDIVFVAVEAGVVVPDDGSAALQPAEIRGLLEEVPAMIWSTRPDGYMDYANSRLLSYYGLSWEQAKGWGWHVGVHPDDWPTLEAKWRSVLADNVPGVNEMRVGNPERGYRWVTTYGSPTLDETGDVVRWYGVIVDTEYRRRIEEALKRNESYLSHGQAITLTGSIGFDPSWEHTYWSPETYKLLGYDPHVQPSRALFVERIHPEDRQHVETTLDAARSDAPELGFEFRMFAGDSAVRNFKFLGKRISDMEGAFYVSVIQDTTEEVAVAEKLRQLEADLASVSKTAMIAEVAASIAHEVNQPLAAIIATGGASIRWLDRPQPNIPNARNNLVAIVEQARKANDVVTRVRSLFRKEEHSTEKIDLPEMLREVIPLVEHLLKRQRIAIDIKISDDVPLVIGDRVQIQQVLLNLILNAIQAMEKSVVRKLCITISHSQAGPVDLQVSDTGPGIPTDKTGRIFEAFFTTKDTGLGLGLSISRTIVERHGGEIVAENQDTGGASFRLSLPVTSDLLTA